MFVFLCGHTDTLMHRRKADMKRLSDILQFTLYSDLGLMFQLRLIQVSVFINLICGRYCCSAGVRITSIFVFD